MSTPAPARARWLTPPGTAALALLQLESGDLQDLIGATPPEVGSACLRSLADVDACVLLRTQADTLLVTPHGGPRIRQRLTEWLHSKGVTFETPASPWRAATDDTVMARVLDTLPRAASDDAIALLLAQPERWRRHGPPGAADAERSRRLQRLIDPPLVALVGPPNAGKSSLLNALAGRTAAVASAQAGTTRDHVSASVTMAGLACLLMDAPGLRLSDDPIESEAIARARERLMRADLLVCVAAPGQRFAETDRPCLRVRTMSDLGGPDPAGTDHGVCSPTGAGLPELAKLVRERLVPAADLAGDRPFDFR